MTEARSAYRRPVALHSLLAAMVVSGCAAPSATPAANRPPEPSPAPPATAAVSGSAAADARTAVAPPSSPQAAPAPGTAACGAAGTGVERFVSSGREAVEVFFGERFARQFEVKVFPDRTALTEFARQRWGMQKTDCWMVAMGVASTMVILSPDAWKTEACEHEPTDAHISQIVTHELVHVFHGQHNPSNEFEGMDDAGWFVEGLAVYAAGQLDADRLARLRRALVAGKGPQRLAQAWSGELRYAVAGSLVQYIDQRLGRARLREMLAATTNAELLAALDLSEDELLAAWRASVAGADGS